MLVVVLDACRPDRLGCYGHDLPTTPAIDALASDPDAVLFERHYVQGAFTKSSTASLFTGLYGFQHGVLRGHDMRPMPGRPQTFAVDVLEDRFETMAERFRALGYRTIGVVKSYHLDPAYGFAQGFDEYVPAAALSSDGRRGRRTTELIAGTEGPFLAYLHLEACHQPFPPEHRDDEFMARHRFDYDESARRAAGVDFTTSAIKDEINEGRIALQPDDRRFLDLIYDAKLRTVDRTLVIPLIQSLRMLGRYDDTLIVLTSDHGEELYDHGGYAHGHALWEEVVRVPLIVKFPRGRRPAGLPDRVQAVTQSVDLLPSLLAYVGADPDAALPGADVFGGAPRGMAWSQTQDQWMLVRGSWKLIAGGGDSALFDLSSDPGEHHDLSVRNPAQVAALREAGDALRAALAVPPGQAPVVERELDPEAIEALRSLGYMR